MNRLRLLFVAGGALALGMLFVQPVLATIKTQQAQISIAIIVNVIPASPVAYLPNQALPSRGQPIAIAYSLKPAPLKLQHTFHAEGLNFVGGASKVVAQAQVQNPLLVQAEVTPNPKATLLQSDNGTYTFPSPVPAGSSETSTGCAFTVTVDSTVAWSLDQGLGTDFVSNDSAPGFSGTDLDNNTFINPSGTPQPKATPYAVYADDGSAWTLTGSGTKLTTYCVELTITVPASASAATYYTNAIYTLYQG